MKMDIFQGNLDDQWKMMLCRASKETDGLFDGNTVVILTEIGNIDSISFQNMDSAIEAENVKSFLIAKKKIGDAKIERIICMWHDGGSLQANRHQ